MALADHLAAPVPRAGQRPRVEQILAGLPDSERGALLILLNDLDRSDEWLGNLLREEGHHLSDAAVRSYRKRQGIQRFKR